jgi:MYXO-CTERM domain-containing protein
VVDFTGDADVDWAVVLAERSGNTVLRSVSSVVTGGAGQVTMDAIGAEDVYLIVSPLTASETKRDYSWDASVVASEPVDTGNGADDSASDGTGTGNGPGNGGGNEKVGGCGCSAAPTSGGGSLGALAGVGLLAAAVARRRRSSR